MQINDDLFIFDEPFQYKEILIYPVKMRDFATFNICATCLTLPKNHEPDISIIKMSYLDYLLYLIFKSKTDSFENKEEDEQVILSMLLCLMQIVLKDQKFQIGWNADGSAKILVNDIEYTSSDFDTIKDIILRQNEVEVEDGSMSFEVLQALRDARKRRAELENTENATIEERVVSLMIYTGWDINKIKDMTSRKFFRCFERIELLETYKICSTASMSGMVKFENKIQHWTAHYKRNGSFDSVKMDADEFSGKFKDVVSFG